MAATAMSEPSHGNVSRAELLALRRIRERHHMESTNAHDVALRYLGLWPYGYCETCQWEGPTRSAGERGEREAADDAREHRRSAAL
jgi:hypothetical protein